MHDADIAGDEIPVPDEPPTPEQQAIIERLSEAEIEQIDSALLSNAIYRWRKVAMIVMSTMSKIPYRVLNIPDVFYASRVRKLVENGYLESESDLRCMRFSEVRLPNSLKSEI